jgi:Fic family protein
MTDGPVRYHLGAFPPPTLDWPRLIALLGPASAALARFDGVLTGVPNAHVLASPLMTEEAVLSSKIEGTQATMGEVLEFEALGDQASVEPEKRLDILEIQNYRKALHGAVRDMETLPLCLRLIRAAHAQLMDGVRGADKQPGEFRTRQNWIGSHGCVVEQARFVPIEPERLPDGMAAWERAIHDAGPGDLLVQLAILHAEFEALHPFLDGNGRLGRMLIPLFLYERKMLSKPVFYMSAYLEANRHEYYDRLLGVSRDGDWTGWCKFFLTGLTIQAESNTAKAKEIVSLYDRAMIQVRELTHSQYTFNVRSARPQTSSLRQAFPKQPPKPF